jgi:hypothetical protein
MPLKIGPLPKGMQRLISYRNRTLFLCRRATTLLKVIFGGSEELPLVWRMSHFLEEKENLWHFFLENDYFTYRGQGYVVFF